MGRLQSRTSRRLTRSVWARACAVIRVIAICAMKASRFFRPPPQASSTSTGPDGVRSRARATTINVKAIAKIKGSG